MFPRTGSGLRKMASGFSFPRERAAIMGVVLGLAVTFFDIALYLFDTPTHLRFIAEDGILENLTVVFWLLGSFGKTRHRPET